MFLIPCIGFLVVLLAHVGDAKGIRASLNAIPPVVIRGGHVTLQCQYELQGAPLYMVKWYRGKHEFYRFSPNDTPKQKMFPGKGIHVDLSLSNQTQVMLKELEFTMSGNFSCEVSADAPSFSTDFVTTYVDVVYPPDSGPIIRTNRNNYGVGDQMQANCTVPKSMPAANLTFLINNQVMTLASKEIHKTDDGLEWTELSMSFILAAAHFRGGRLILRCVAQLHPVYAEYTTATFDAKLGPKPERMQSSASIFTVCPLLILILLIVSTLASLDYEVYDYSDDISANDIPESILEKLI